ncbi:MAG: amidohydrolase [Acidaminobacter sp.]|uniref:M20 metallopeptidase family protein n=1 Tax=Acidaminobacter sp. TaxID=1872102 RepID=UPI00137FECAE|nr:amidohydrolase [Acidaminobacter sp.]MZQ97457.1 amidohydrolase [Acidaminobacter sp.]
MDTIKQAVLALESELIELRRDFHRHPELGYQEFRTSGIVKNYLEALGIETQVVTGTGVVGLLKGEKDPGSADGPTILLRADMDALAQEEKSGVDYTSQTPGLMHACGHDGHTAMLLVAAKILSGYKDQLKGNVKFVFQPNEEEAGALNMIEAGILENPKVDAAFGVHIWTPVPSGKIGLSNGPVMAATEEFELAIIGQPGHTSTPHTAKDPILAASTILQLLQSIQTREIDPLVPITIMVGRIKGGSGRNIIADRVELGGTIRFMFANEPVEKKILLEKFERLIKGVCEAQDVGYELKYIPSNPTLMNDERMVQVLREAVVETIGGPEGIIEHRCMAGEDFAEFTQKVPSAFYFLGTGNAEVGSQYPHHHTCFNIDESTLKTGVEIHVRTIMNMLK